jgi:type I restriction enzyme, R subunit
MLALLCEPVEPPRGELEHIHYFCGNTEIPERSQGTRTAARCALQGTVALHPRLRQHRRRTRTCRLFPADIARIKQKLDEYLRLREIIRKASGETLDLKPYEADMRHLIDTYIEADEPRKISPSTTSVCSN